MAIWERLLAGVKSAVELRVVTYVGDVEISGEVCNPEIRLPDGQHKAIVTCLNLADGDITSCFPEEYLTEERSWVRSYHDEQVKQGKDVVERNLKLLGEVGKMLAEAISELKAAETS